MNKSIDLYNLSYPQKGIWNIEKLYPNTSICNLSGTLKIESKLDLNKLNKAFNYVIKKNDALRIRISEVNGVPKQYIVPYIYQKIDIFDFSQNDISDLYDWDNNITKKPFYKTDSQLFYFAIIVTNKNHIRLFFKLHHLIADAWTLITLGNNVMGHYKTIIEGKQVTEETKPSYIDYILSEQKYMNSTRFSKDKSYWLEKFNGTSKLNTLKPQKISQINIEAKRKTFILPEKLSKKIRQHCKMNKTSIFSLYLGAMALYFNRTKGDNEVIFGTPVLNRSNVKQKNTIGMFISTAPIKVVIDDTKDYTTFAKSINDEWLSLLRHQKYPYLLLLENLKNKNKNFQKLFDIVISYQNAKFIKSESDYPQEGRWHHSGYQVDSLNIHINDRENDGDIIIDYDYLSNLFYSKEINFLHKHVISLLWHSIDNPSRKLPLIEMISEDEKEKILYEFNNTKSKYPKNKTINTLFEKQVKIDPKADCIIFYNQKISYEQFNKKSNRIARHLKKNNLKQGDIVSIMIPRSIDLLIGIMGIIKAGGTYLPLDTNYPIERINLIIKDSNCKLLLTHSSQKENFPEQFKNIEIDKINLNIYDDSNLKNINTTNDLLYIIYTSGTTGTPKGVMITHKNVINLIYSAKSLVNYNHSIVLSKTTITFDVFVLESFLPLLTGAKIIMTNDDDQKNSFDINKLIIEHSANIIHSTPSRLKDMLSQSNAKEAFQSLTDITTGGEILTNSLLSNIKKITKSNIYNVYGPTETTVYSTFDNVTNKLDISIGKPINNTKIFILDKHKNLLPIGIVGDLYVGGEGLSQGYLNRSELTKDRFIANKYFPYKRIYKTGDLARWYSKGQLEFIGREDNQFKIRGIRIELDEINSNILSYKEVISSVVLIKEKNSRKFICAYVVCDKNIDFDDLRKYLLKRIPSYMIPSYFISLDKLPLTSNGKVDVQSLVSLKNNDISSHKYESPNTDNEKILVSVWETILGIDKIGINDDFFKLGGDSLNIAQLTSILVQHNKVITFHDIYLNPTIKDLAKIMGNANSHSIAQETPIPLVDINNNTYDINNFLLDKLIRTKVLPPLDSAAITYIPEDIMELTDFSEDPILFNYLKTSQGNIGLYAIPISNAELYNNKTRLVNLCVQAIEQAKTLGATMVSLTGLIPSATSYGYDIDKRLKERDINIGITTGHATTAASVILSIERLLNDSNRDIALENIALVGVGSVGTAVTKLLLSVLPHTSSITLCDIYQKSEFLFDFKSEIKHQFNYKGEINISLSDGISVPKQIYNASLIIGATNVPNIIDINKLTPGTLIVDDSGPHCFKKEDAIERLSIEKDILFTEGGILESKLPIIKKMYLPSKIKDTILSSYYEHFMSKKEITGCILSGLLTSKYKEINPILGTTELKECIMNYNVLKTLHYKGALLHCDNYIIPKKFITEFKSKYSAKMRKIHSGGKND